MTLAKRPQLVATLRALFYLGAVLAAILIARQYWTDISPALTASDPLLLIAALLIGGGTLYIQSLMWHILLKSVRHEITIQQSYRTFFRSLVTRYLPGGVWMFLARIALTIQLGFSKSRVLFLLYVEALIAVVSGTILVLAMGHTIVLPWALYVLFGIMLLTAGLLLVAPRYLLLLADRLKKSVAAVSISGRTILVASLLMVLSWIGFGISTMLVVAGLSDLQSLTLLQAISAFAASWVIGFLIIIIPSGLGIREAALTFLLSPLLGFPLAFTTAIALRLVFLVAEFVHFAVAWIGKTENRTGKH